MTRFAYPPGGGGGGGGTPAPPDTSVQFNAAGSFGGDARFTFDSTTGLVSENIKLGMQFAAIGASPGNYTFANSGIQFINGVGDEIGRIWFTDPDDTDDYNSLNLYFGLDAGKNQPTDNTSAGYRNLGIFTRSLYNITTGFDNYGIGHECLYNCTEGSDNQGYGYFTLHSITTGSDNTANGNSALYNTQAGNQNTAMGSGAGIFLGEGDDNSFFGFFAGTPAGSGYGYVVNNSIAIGKRAEVSADNRAVIGNADVTDIYFGSEAAVAAIHAKDIVVGNVAIADLPLTPAAGTIISVSDALAPAWGITVGSGGSAYALVNYNGASWTVIGI